MEAVDYHYIWRSGHRFEVEQHNNKFVVDLEESICGYRVWDLTGKPCCHAVAAIMYVRKKAEYFVSVWYTKVIWALAYEYIIESVPSMKSWPRTKYPIVFSLL